MRRSEKEAIARLRESSVRDALTLEMALEERDSLLASYRGLLEATRNRHRRWAIDARRRLMDLNGGVE